MAIKRALDQKRLGEWSTIGSFKGRNIMGKVLMLCKRAFEEDESPVIDYALLESKHINILGKKLTFSQYIVAA